MAWNDKFNSVSNRNASNLFLCNPFWLNRTIAYLSMQFPIVCDFTNSVCFYHRFEPFELFQFIFRFFFSLSIPFILVWNNFGFVFFFQLLFQYFWLNWIFFHGYCKLYPNWKFDCTFWNWSFVQLLLVSLECLIWFLFDFIFFIFACFSQLLNIFVC